LENRENTLDAFEKCISIGYDYIETDVRETKDGKLVIFHDEDLSRICGLQIKINQLEYNCNYENQLSNVNDNYLYHNKDKNIISKTDDHNIISIENSDR
jgi:glycerophosphoryl diester phosphodiesterase